MMRIMKKLFLFVLAIISMVAYGGLKWDHYIDEDADKQYTHFGVLFTNKEHRIFVNDAWKALANPWQGSIKWRFLGDHAQWCEEGNKKNCKTAIKIISKLIEVNHFGYDVFWKKRIMHKYVILLKRLEERKTQIEELEKLPDQDCITRSDIRAYF